MDYVGQKRNENVEAVILKDLLSSTDAALTTDTSLRLNSQTQSTPRFEPVAVPEPRAPRSVPGGGGTGQRSNQSGRPASGNQSPSDAAGASPGATAD